MLYVGAQFGRGFFDRITRDVETDLREDDPTLGPPATHIFLARLRTAPTGWLPYPLTGLEAVPSGVHVFDAAGRLHQATTRAYAFDLAPAVEAPIWFKASTYIGKPYDFYGLALAWFYVRFGRRSHFYKSRHVSVFCSEVAVDAFQAGIPDCCGGMDAWVITPAVFERWCAKTGERVSADPAPSH